MKKSLIAAALAASLAACATGPSYDEVMAQAQAEAKVAKKMNYLWRDTEKSMKEAEKAKKAGDDDKALKLAKKALFQAKAAQKQAQAEANAGPKYN